MASTKKKDFQSYVCIYVGWYQTLTSQIVWSM